MDMTRNVEYALREGHLPLTNLPASHDSINISLYRQVHYMKSQLMQILQPKLVA